eukprot:TRINITY_DN4005_c0_g1_i3.p1 TRINITY_DN4005_c0_g1~~TRINITY_DN4005_c0_g1_i3.p1  ORF type:complete len:185 (+),score=36.90 TRINITY_DN4005_c0_g1_i3:216-770(+)
MLFRCALFALALLSTHSLAEVVLVTGATGRTGSLVYTQLKAAGFQTRALVRNASKAAAELGCGACGEAEGIFEGDVTKPETLPRAMTNVSRLVIAVGATPKCLLGPLDCHYPTGGYPKDVDYQGTKNQVLAALAAGVQHVVLLSSMGTTEPDGFLDKMGHGWDCLLYTSPSPRDRTRSRMPSSA